MIRSKDSRHNYGFVFVRSAYFRIDGIEAAQYSAKGTAVTINTVTYLNTSKNRGDKIWLGKRFFYYNQTRYPTLLKALRAEEAKP